MLCPVCEKPWNDHEDECPEEGQPLPTFDISEMSDTLRECFNELEKNKGN